MSRKLFSAHPDFILLPSQACGGHQANLYSLHYFRNAFNPFCDNEKIFLDKIVVIGEHCSSETTRLCAYISEQENQNVIAALPILSMETVFLKRNKNDVKFLRHLRAISLRCLHEFC